MWAKSAIISVLMLFVPLASLDVSTMAFPRTQVGVTEADGLTAVLTTDATITISSIAISGTNAADFSIAATDIKLFPNGAQSPAGTNCDGGFDANHGCILFVTFTPSQRGPRSATLTITSDASNSPQTISLSGIGIGISIMGATTLRGQAVVR
jgi:hypothetical protein